MQLGWSGVRVAGSSTSGLFMCYVGAGVNGRLKFVTVFTVRKERWVNNILHITSFHELQELNPKHCSFSFWI